MVFAADDGIVGREAWTRDLDASPAVVDPAGPVLGCLALSDGLQVLLGQ